MRFDASESASEPPARSKRAPGSRPAIFGRSMLLGVWLPTLTIGLFHYATSSELHWMHDVLRRLYYLPIIAAAFIAGTRGGLAASVVVSLTYLPHAFVHLGHLAHMDPGDTVHKALEVVLYNVIGAVAGVLADRERRRREQLAIALDTQRRLQRELVRAGRLSALGEVVAGVAHEIKNPIHSLKGTAEVIEPLVPRDCAERRLWELHVAELGRLEKIADRFVSFAKPAALTIDELDLREVVQRLCELMEADVKKRGLVLERDVPARAVPLRGDRDQLAQIGINLVLNAVRALEAKDGGRIRVRAQLAPAGERMHRFVVENDGPPIARDEIEHVFDPFHAGETGGTGLGLSISERIAEQHGGYIQAENAGLGVRFTVHLPAVEPQPGRTD